MKKSPILKKLEEHDKRFDEHDQKFVNIDKRFDAHDKKFEQINKKLRNHDRQFRTFSRILLSHDKRLENIEDNMVTKKDFNKMTITLDTIAVNVNKLVEDKVVTNDRLDLIEVKSGIKPPKNHVHNQV